MRRFTFALIALFGLYGSVVVAFAQAPSPLPATTLSEGILIPAVPQEKKDDPKAPKPKQPDPKAPAPKPADAVPPPVTFPTTNTAALPAQDLAAAGASSSRSALPNVFGDLPGGGGNFGPLPVPIARDGRPIGFRPVFVLPGGRRLVFGGQGQPPVDESVFAQNPVAPLGTPVDRVIGVLPPEGAVFAPELKDRVSRIPLASYGAFKITENESPRPTTRAYFTYNYFDNVFQSSAPLVPRIGLHQEIFGAEYAFSENRFSVGVRQPYYQITSPGFFNQTALGDLTFIAKGVIAEDAASGDLLSAGVAITVPTGRPPIFSTITGERVHSTLIQPYVGYILTSGDWFLQGFTSLIVPTDASDVTLLSNDAQVGYALYRNEGAFLSGIFPVVEGHYNRPLNHRGSRSEPIGFADTLTFLGGWQMSFFDKASLGFVVGTPVTGPRPFSLQATTQFNLRF